MSEHIKIEQKNEELHEVKNDKGYLLGQFKKERGYWNFHPRPVWNYSSYQLINMGKELEKIENK